MAKRQPSVVRHPSGMLMLVDTSTTPHQTKVSKLIRMCGMYATALYLKKREYTLDEALVLTLGTHERFKNLAPVTV